MAGWRVGVDIGGTFTDVVAWNSVTSVMLSAKVRTFVSDPIRSVLAGLDAVGLAWDEVDDLVHGTTIVTNAIVEGRQAKVAFVTTEGFADVLTIGRQNRQHLYRLDLAPKLAPQVPDDLCFEIEERIDFRGQLVQKMNSAAIERLVETLREREVEAVAISLLHSYANSAHERALATQIRKVIRHVASSHHVNPEAREFERASTTVLSASVMPMVAGYIDRIERRKPEKSRLHFFHSASGLCAPAALRELPLALALSGPAAGVAAAGQVARDLGIGRALTFDMGGTTTDVCLVVDGEAEIAADRSLAGRPLRMPAVAVEAIGAGGGSLVRHDDGMIRVGPESAGADPGAACYGLGGTAPTISDANMVLGFLEDGATFGGGIVLDRKLAERALEPVAKALQLGLEATAEGIRRVANNAMANALRRITVERGIDARTCTLVAFGGAGPMHGVEVAQLVGIDRVIVPNHSGALSALGCVSSDTSYTQHRTVHIAATQWDRARLDAVRSEIVADVTRLLGPAQTAPTLKWVAALRYAGQSYAIELSDPALDDPEQLGARFRERHRQLYDFATGEPWELVALRLTATVPRETGALPTQAQSLQPASPSKQRQCSFGGAAPQWVPQYQRDALSAGQRIAGPAIVTDAMSTLVLPPGCSMTTTGHGHLEIRIGDADD